MSTKNLCVEFNDNEAILVNSLQVPEIELAKEWTAGRIVNRQAFFDAISTENIEALKALRVICLRRNDIGTAPRFADVTLDIEAVEAYFIDADGREIEPDVIRDDDGDPVMKLEPDGSLRPKVHKHEDGRTDRWVYADTRDVVPADPRKDRRRAKISATIPDTL